MVRNMIIALLQIHFYCMDYTHLCNMHWSQLLKLAKLMIDFYSLSAERGRTMGPPGRPELWVFSTGDIHPVDKVRTHSVCAGCTIHAA